MSVIAGYPWFEDWGRDTFIALPGLTLVTGRFEIARSILATFADHMQRGLLPNRFPDKAFRPDYNTVDASLWFIHAAYQYWRYSGDGAFLSKYLYPKLVEIVDSYSRGTDFGTPWAENTTGAAVSGISARSSTKTAPLVLRLATTYLLWTMSWRT